MRSLIIRTLTALCGFALVLFGVSPLFGQGATATISGTVVDASGALIAEASIQVRNTGTGIVQTTASDGEGRYRVADLVIGDYEVQAAKAGFQTVVHRGITLSVGSNPVVDISLPV